MRRKTPAGRPESAPEPKRSAKSDRRSDRDPFDFDGDFEPAGPGSSAIRLNKFLAQNGIASRRASDELIASGQVMIDGKIVTELGRRVDPEKEKVEVDGIVLRATGERLAYYLLNKPKGVVCTNDPREARPRAIDLVTDPRKGRIYTVGRLDEDTEGLVILTNDGEFANRISHPRYGLRKTYWVDVRGRVPDESIERMCQGVRLSDGKAGFESVRILKRHAERSILLVVLAEGKNREVRRVLAALDLPVRNLRRVEIGPLRDKRLKRGQWRVLSRSEVGELLEATRSGSVHAAGGGRAVRPVRRGTKPWSSPGRRPWSARAPKRSDGSGRGERGGRTGRARPGAGPRPKHR